MTGFERMFAISRLNNDCLVAIFYEAVIQYEYIHGCTTYRGQELVNLSHVCRLWRVLVLSLSELWAGVVTAFPCGLYERLERARGLPLTFGPHHNWTHRHWSMQCSYLLAHVERFSAITGDHHHRLSWIETLSGKSLPLLRHATFSNEEPGYFPDVSVQADELRSLSLQHFAVRFSAPKLTSLAIHMAFEWEVLKHFPSGLDSSIVPVLPASQLVAILGDTPLLTHLELHHCLFSDDWDPSNTEKYNVVLNRLESLVISTDYCGHIAAFLRNIVIPTKTSLRIDTWSPRWLSEIRHLSHSMAPYMRSSLYDAVRMTNHCYYLHNDHVFFELFHDVHDYHSAAPIAVYIAESESQDIAVTSLQMCEAFFAELPCAVIRRLYVQPSLTDPTFSAGDTPAVFHITALTASVETLIFYPEMLMISDLDDQPLPSNYGTGLLPDLILDWPAEYPALKYVEISSYTHLYSKVVTSENMGRVKQWLESRVEIGYPIQSLTLCGTIDEGKDTGKACDIGLFDSLLGLVELTDKRRVFRRGRT